MYISIALISWLTNFANRKPWLKHLKYISVTMIPKIGLCVVLINLALVHSFGLMNLININEDEFVSQLNRVLKKNEHERHLNHISVRSSRKDLNEAHKFERKKLIKTILPHGQEVMITKSNAFYKPLVRLHMKPTFVRDNDEYKLELDSVRSTTDSDENNEDDVLKQNQTNHRNVSKIWQKLKELKNKQKEEYEKNLRSFQEYKNAANDDQYKLELDSVDKSRPDNVEGDELKQSKINPTNISEIWQKLKELKNKQKEEYENKNLRTFKEYVQLKTAKVGKKFSNYWERFKTALPIRNKQKNPNKDRGIPKRKEKRSPKKERATLHKLLRLFDDSGDHVTSGAKYLRQRSGEEHDPLAPGKIPFGMDYEMVTTKTELWQPSYSFWNYWTYDKSLHQDNCKGSLIRVGNHCIGSPPH